MRNISDDFADKIKIRNLCPHNFPGNRTFMRQRGKIWCSQTGHRWQNGARALHVI